MFSFFAFHAPFYILLHSVLLFLLPCNQCLRSAFLAVRCSCSFFFAIRCSCVFVLAISFRVSSFSQSVFYSPYALHAFFIFLLPRNRFFVMLIPRRPFSWFSFIAISFHTFPALHFVFMLLLPSILF